MRTIFKNIWFIITLPFVLIQRVFRTISRLFNHIRKDIHFLLSEEAEDVPLDETLTKSIQNPSSLTVHINALRKHLFRSLIFIAITTTFSFLYTSKIVDFLAQPIGGLKNLVAIDVTEPIGVFMRVALLSGFTIALPYVFLEFWLFVAPGLKRTSRFRSLATIPIATILFFGGMAFAYFILLPVGIPWLITVLGIPTEIRPSSYIQFVTTVLFWIGMAFEFPLIIYFLALVGFVKGKTLAEQWRLAIVIIAILAAAITPTIDPINMSLVMVPMILLYFIGMGLAYMAERSRNNANSQEKVS